MPKKNVATNRRRPKAAQRPQRPAPRVSRPPATQSPARQTPWRARRQHVTTTAGIVRIEHSELVCPVLTSNVSYAYAIDSFSLNPSSNTFPWLQNASRLYDQYRLKRLELKFVSGSRTTRDGSVAVGIDFDITDVPPNSMTDLARLEHSAVGQIHQPLNVPVPIRQQAQNWYYTADTHQAVDRLSEVGQIFVATEGVEVTGTGFTTGFLEAHYVYEFRMPELLTLDITEPAEYTMRVDRGNLNSQLLFQNDNVLPIVDSSHVNGTLVKAVNTTTKRVPVNGHAMLRLTAGIWKVIVSYAKPTAFAGWATTDVRTIAPAFVDSFTGMFVYPNVSTIVSAGKLLNDAGNLAVGYYREFYVTLTRIAYFYAELQHNYVASSVAGGTTTCSVTRARINELTSPDNAPAFGRYDTAPPICTIERAHQLKRTSEEAAKAASVDCPTT